MRKIWNSFVFTFRSDVIATALAIISFFLATPASCKARLASRSARVFWANALKNRSIDAMYDYWESNTYKQVLLQTIVVSYSSDPSQQSKESSFSMGRFGIPEIQHTTNAIANIMRRYHGTDITFVFTKEVSVWTSRCSRFITSI